MKILGVKQGPLVAWALPQANLVIITVLRADLLPLSRAHGGYPMSASQRRSLRQAEVLSARGRVLLCNPFAGATEFNLKRICQLPPNGVGWFWDP